MLITGSLVVHKSWSFDQYQHQMAMVGVESGSLTSTSIQHWSFDQYQGVIQEPSTWPAWYRSRTWYHGFWITPWCCSKAMNTLISLAATKIYLCSQKCKAIGVVSNLWFTCWFILLTISFMMSAINVLKYSNITGIKNVKLLPKQPCERESGWYKWWVVFVYHTPLTTTPWNSCAVVTLFTGRGQTCQIGMVIVTFRAHIIQVTVQVLWNVTHGRQVVTFAAKWFVLICRNCPLVCLQLVARSSLWVVLCRPVTFSEQNITWTN